VRYQETKLNTQIRDNDRHRIFYSFIQ